MSKKQQAEPLQPSLKGTLINLSPFNRRLKAHVMWSGCVKTSDVECWCQRIKCPARH